MPALVPWAELISSEDWAHCSNDLRAWTRYPLCLTAWATKVQQQSHTTKTRRRVLLYLASCMCTTELIYRLVYLLGHNVRCVWPCHLWEKKAKEGCHLIPLASSITCTSLGTYRRSQTRTMTLVSTLFLALPDGSFTWAKKVPFLYEVNHWVQVRKTSSF